MLGKGPGAGKAGNSGEQGGNLGINLGNCSTAGPAKDGTIPFPEGIPLE